jgi:hypothetical protein
MIRAIATALAVALDRDLMSGPSQRASNASACGSLATRPAVLTLPPSAIATSQTSRSTSIPILRISLPAPA